MSIEDLINACINAKVGNKEFALFGFGDGWRAEIGNTCASVMLGEAEAEFSADGSTIEGALKSLLSSIQREKRPPLPMSTA